MSVDVRRQMRTSLHKLIREAGLHWFLALGLAGCASSQSPPEPVSATSYVTNGAVSRVQYLHRLNINDAPGLRSGLQKALSYDVLALWSLVQHPITASERQRSYEALRLIAVQNEKFPVPSLNDDPEIRKILRVAVENDPMHTEELRSRNWTKPMWQQ